jgi:hypothetical protein
MAKSLNNSRPQAKPKEKQYHRNGLLGLATQKGGQKKENKRIGTVSCTPESKTLPKSPNKIVVGCTRHSLSQAVRRRCQSGLRPQPRTSPHSRPATMAVAAGLSRRCSVRRLVDLSPSENNRLRPVLVIACPCPLAASLLLLDRLWFTGDGERSICFLVLTDVNLGQIGC